jgi:predicted nuclease of predicted toxin-antitoxin system
MPLRLHCDENVNPRLAKALRQRGIDVTTTPEAGLLGVDDEAQLTFGRESGRVIFSHDVDFLRIANRNSNHAGVVFCEKDKHSLGEMIVGLLLICEVMLPEEMQGHVEYL